ncbi:MAG TPA: hypothetical protein VGM75_23970 [Pseudonocardiaceae bacterium]
MYPNVDSGAWRPVPAPPPNHQQGPDSGEGGDAALRAAEEAVAALDGLAELPVTEHVGRFDLAHAALTEALASIDKV